MSVLSNVICQAQIGEISLWHQHANPTFSTNKLGSTVDSWWRPVWKIDWQNMH